LSSILPSELLTSLEGVAGFDAAAFEKVHVEGPRVTSIRLNPAKMQIGSDPLTRGGVALQEGVGLTGGVGLNGGVGLPGGVGLLPAGASPVPWSSFGYYLPERPSFTFDPLFHAGAYYVQEASSMFLEQALRQTTDLSRPLRVLDLCAAPGGKSTLLQSLLSRDSLLVSNEVIPVTIRGISSGSKIISM